MEILTASLTLMWVLIQPTSVITCHTTQPLPCNPLPGDFLICAGLNGSGRGNFYAFPMILNIDFSLNDGIISGVRASVPNAPRECINALVYIMCLIGAPPCNQDTCLPVKICNDSCAAFKRLQAEKLCDAEHERLRQLRSSTPLSDVRLLVDTYFRFNCEDPSSYFFMNFTNFDSDGCTDLFPPDIKSFLLNFNSSERAESQSTTSPSKDTDDQTLLLAILLPLLFILFAVVLFTVICLSCYFCHRKRVKSAKEMQFAEVNGFSKSQEQDSDSVSSCRYVRASFKGGNDEEGIFKDVLILCETLTLGDVLGQGAFGKVFKGEYESENGTQAVAVKMLKDVESHNEFLSESAIMKDFHHPNVLGLVGVVFDTPDGVPYLVLPFMEFGNLKSFLKSRRIEGAINNELPEGLDLSNLTRICIDIAQGMEYLAEKKFVHRDLAARNCMVGKDLLIKVGDFGLARDIYCTDYYRSSNKDAKLPIKWMPPEAFNDKISNEKTDVWSYGVTCWEVFSLGKTPYPTVPNCEIFHYISTGGRLRKPDLCPDEMFEFMENCWEMKSEDRPNFSQLVKKLAGYWDDEYRYI